MELRNVRAAGRFTRSRAIIECAQCGKPLYLPEWSEYLDSGGIRHLWRCEACDYTFETTAHYAAA